MTDGAMREPPPLPIPEGSSVATVSPARVPCTLGELAGYFLRLGTFGFGGPLALAGYMQQDLVDERRWLSKEDYVEGLALAQMASDTTDSTSE